MTAKAVRVVTVSREYGSGGAAVATALARKLSFQLLDRRLILAISRVGNIEPGLADRFDERVDPWLHRLGKALWHGGFEAVSAVDESVVVDADRLASLSRQVIQEAGKLGGCVIVGRGAQCVLRDRADAFHTFVYAPKSRRVEVLRARLGERVDIEATLVATDGERASFLKEYYGSDWKDPLLYDLMVNSALGLDNAVEILAAAVNARGVEH